MTDKERYQRLSDAQPSDDDLAWALKMRAQVTKMQSALQHYIGEFSQEGDVRMMEVAVMVHDLAHFVEILFTAAGWPGSPSRPRSGTPPRRAPGDGTDQSAW